LSVSPRLKMKQLDLELAVLNAHAGVKILLDWQDA
jgi:hypothetical protein